MIPVVIVYELVSLAFVWLNPTGRRIEDHLAGTQVITRNAYGKLHRCCALCGERLFVGAKLLLTVWSAIEDQ